MLVLVKSLDFYLPRCEDEISNIPGRAVDFLRLGLKHFPSKNRRGEGGGVLMVGGGY